MHITIEDNLSEFMKELDRVALTQIPYATALAINDLAQQVKDGEVAEVSKEFPTLTPFTKMAFGVINATKSVPIATIFIKDVQAHYLGAYIDQTASVPTPGGAMVVPVNIKLNVYGNIPYKKITNMLGNGNVFYAHKGEIKARPSAPSGVYERYTSDEGGKKVRHLRLIAAMKDPWSLKQHFSFYDRADAIVQSGFREAMEQAMVQAMGSMR